MKKLLLFVFLNFLALHSIAQDIPLFSQKLTNSFMYNPALAGHTFGSMTASYRMNYLGVTDAPTNTFLSFHAPFANYRFGSGSIFFRKRLVSGRTRTYRLPLLTIYISHATAYFRLVWVGVQYDQAWRYYRH
jgi:Protein of unknown function (DUF3308).